MPEAAEAIRRQVAGCCGSVESNRGPARIGRDGGRVGDVLQSIHSAHVVYVLPGLATVIRSGDDRLRAIAGRTGHRKVRAAVVLDADRRIALSAGRGWNLLNGPGRADDLRTEISTLPVQVVEQ